MTFASILFWLQTFLCVAATLLYMVTRRELMALRWLLVGNQKGLTWTK